MYPQEFFREFVKTFIREFFQVSTGSVFRISFWISFRNCFVRQIRKEFLLGFSTHFLLRDFLGAFHWVKSYFESLSRNSSECPCRDSYGSSIMNFFLRKSRELTAISTGTAKGVPKVAPEEIPKWPLEGIPLSKELLHKLPNGFQEKLPKEFYEMFSGDFLKVFLEWMPEK